MKSQHNLNMNMENSYARNVSKYLKLISSQLCAFMHENRFIYSSPISFCVEKNGMQMNEK